MAVTMNPVTAATIELKIASSVQDDLRFGRETYAIPNKTRPFWGRRRSAPIIPTFGPGNSCCSLGPVCVFIRAQRARAALAQPVEHIIRNDGVACSSHAGGTSFLAKRRIFGFVAVAAACKTRQGNIRMSDYLKKSKARDTSIPIRCIHLRQRNVRRARLGCKPTFKVNLFSVHISEARAAAIGWENL
jgi:hypothetical protein